MLIQEEAAFHDVIKYLCEDLIDDDMERTKKSIVTVIRSPGRNKKNIMCFGKRNYHMQVAEHQAMWG